MTALGGRALDSGSAPMASAITHSTQNVRAASWLLARPRPRRPHATATTASGTSEGETGRPPTQIEPGVPTK